MSKSLLFKLVLLCILLAAVIYVQMMLAPTDGSSSGLQFFSAEPSSSSH